MIGGYNRFTCAGTTVCDFLVIAGGGGGGGNMIYDQGCGGGGAGGMREFSSISFSAGSHIITIGKGGQGARTETIRGNNGENSSVAITGGSTYTSRPRGRRQPRTRRGARATRKATARTR